MALLLKHQRLWEQSREVNFISKSVIPNLNTQIAQLVNACFLAGNTCRQGLESHSGQALTIGAMRWTLTYPGDRASFHTVVCWLCFQLSRRFPCAFRIVFKLQIAPKPQTFCKVFASLNCIPNPYKYFVSPLLQSACGTQRVENV